MMDMFFYFLLGLLCVFVFIFVLAFVLTIGCGIILAGLDFLIDKVRDHTGL